MSNFHFHSFTLTVAFIAKQQPHLPQQTSFIFFTCDLTSHMLIPNSLFSSTSLAYSFA